MSRYKPDSARQWRGKSYKKGGELVTELREADKAKTPEPACCEACEKGLPCECADAL